LAPFVSERVDGIELRCLPRGIKAEDDADGGVERHRDEDDVDLNLHRPLEPRGQPPRHPDPACDAHQTSGDRQYERFDQELEEDARRLRADGHADADLARPFRDADEHDVHDADAADQQRDGGDAREQRQDRVGALRLRRTTPSQLSRVALR
jgi:hypothetical protein